MNTHLAIVGRRSSETVPGPDGTPLDLADVAVPTSLEAPTAARLLDAIDDTLREMRTRQAQFPSGATSELRLGLVVTAANGTGTEVLTGSVNLRDLDFATTADRETVLHELQALEQEFLSGD